MVRFIFLAILTSFIFAHDIDVTLDFKHSSGGSSERKKYFCSRAREEPIHPFRVVYNAIASQRCEWSWTDAKKRSKLLCDIQESKIASCNPRHLTLTHLTFNLWICAAIIAPNSFRLYAMLFHSSHVYIFFSAQRQQQQSSNNNKKNYYSVCYMRMNSRLRCAIVAFVYFFLLHSSIHTFFFW